MTQRRRLTGSVLTESSERTNKILKTFRKDKQWLKKRVQELNRIIKVQNASVTKRSWAEKEEQKYKQRLRDGTELELITAQETAARQAREIQMREKI